MYLTIPLVLAGTQQVPYLKGLKHKWLYTRGKIEFYRPLNHYHFHYASLCLINYHQWAPKSSCTLCITAGYYIRRSKKHCSTSEWHNDAEQRFPAHYTKKNSFTFKVSTLKVVNISKSYVLHPCTLPGFLCTRQYNVNETSLRRTLVLSLSTQLKKTCTLRLHRPS